jgi:3',5'-cyclic AMP phosphodiesterase CpdA
MHRHLSRRDAIKLTGTAAAAAALAGGVSLHAMAAGKSPRRGRGKRVLRIAHLTDIHVVPENRAEYWLTECLRQVQGMKDKPDLILNGGDCVGDSLGAEEGRVRTLWQLFRKVFQNECSLPVEHCIGNHDVWGWNREKSGTTGKEPLYGKQWAMESLELATPYRRFDRAGWRFFVLDSTHRSDSATYTARLDDAQVEWLKSELAATDPNTPVLILSHIPILSACAYFDGDNEEKGYWAVPGAWMHIDARRIKDLFLEHPNVKLALSGHIHLKDRVDYNGVTYLCNGAVSGSWWGGPYQECPPGYAIVDLFSDGSFESEYRTYGWKKEG